MCDKINYIYGEKILDQKYCSNRTDAAVNASIISLGMIAVF